MKKLVSLVIIVLLFFSCIPLQAAESTSDTYTLTLQDAIAKTLLNSPDLKKADVMVDMVKKNKADTNDLYDNMKNKSQATGASIISQMKAVDANLAVLPPDQIATKSGLLVTKKALSASLDSLNNLDESIKQLKDISEQLDDAYDDARVARGDAEKKVAFGIEKLYLSMLNLDDFIKLQEDNVAFRYNMLDIEKLKEQNGLSTAVKVEKVAQEVMDEQEALKNLKNTRSLLAYQMNRNVGRKWDSPLKLAQVVLEGVKTQDLEAGYESSLDNALAIEQLKRNIKDKKDDYRKYKGNSTITDKIKIELKDTDLSLDNTEYNIKSTLEDLHNKLQVTQKILADAKSKSGTAQVEYDQTNTLYEQGMALKVHLKGSELALGKAQTEYTKAKYDYYLAARELKLAETGIFLNEIKG